VKAFLAFMCRQVRLDCDPRDPGEPFARKHKRPTIALLARHARIHEQVLQLAGASAAQRAHPQTGAPEADVDVQAGVKVSRAAVLAAGALPDLETRWSWGGRPRRYDFHVAPHDTESQGAWKVDAASAPSRLGQLQHRRELSPRKTGLRTTGLGVHAPQGFDCGGHALGLLLQARHRKRGRVESSRDAGPVALQRRKDLSPDAHAREPRFAVGWVLVCDDASLSKKLTHVLSPHIEHRPDVMTPLRGHAAESGEPAATHEVKNDALDEVIRGVPERDDIGVSLCAGAIQKCVAEMPGRRLE